jgi:hypothetical protein
LEWERGWVRVRVWSRSAAVDMGPTGFFTDTMKALVGPIT